MQLVFYKHFELDIAIVGEVNEFELKVVPIVEGEDKGVYFLIEIKPLEGSNSVLTFFLKLELV